MFLVPFLVLAEFARATKATRITPFSNMFEWLLNSKAKPQVNFAKKRIEPNSVPEENWFRLTSRPSNFNLLIHFKSTYISKVEKCQIKEIREQKCPSGNTAQNHKQKSCTDFSMQIKRPNIQLYLFYKEKIKLVLLITQQIQTWTPATRIL